MFEKQLKAGPSWASTAAFFAALASLLVLSPLMWTTSEGVPITLQSLLETWAWIVGQNRIRKPHIGSLVTCRGILGKN